MIPRQRVHLRMAPHPGSGFPQPVNHILFIYHLLSFFRFGPFFIIAVRTLVGRFQRTHDLASAFRYNINSVDQFIGSLPYFNIGCIFSVDGRRFGKVVFEQTVCQALQLRIQTHLHRFRADHGHAKIQILHLRFNGSPGCFLKISNHSFLRLFGRNNTY